MCLAFFIGKGYNRDFTENMSKIKEELKRNPKVCIADNADDICAYCPNHSSGMCISRDKTDEYDQKALALCGLKAGTEMEWGEFEQLIKSRILDAGKRKEICGDCQWDFLCYSNILTDA